jgi:hypothetical protein
MERSPMTTRTTFLSAAHDHRVKYSTLATVLPDRVRHILLMRYWCNPASLGRGGPSWDDEVLH